jgi:hypothetical protein
MRGEKKMDLMLVVSKIPKDLVRLLLFENWSNRIVIRAKRPLPADEFSKLAGIVSDLGGEWIQAGKDSRFEIIDRQRKQIC